MPANVTLLKAVNSEHIWVHEIQIHPNFVSAMTDPGQCRPCQIPLPMPVTTRTPILYIMEQKMSNSKHASYEYRDFFPLNLTPDNRRIPLYMSSTNNIAFLRDGIRISQSSDISFDSVFNSLYEREIVLSTAAARAALRLEVIGRCLIQLVYVDPNGIEKVYSSINTTDPNDSAGCQIPISVSMSNSKLAPPPIRTPQRIVLPFELSYSEQRFGRWFFRIRTFETSVLLTDGSWQILPKQSNNIMPAIVICTYRREAALSRNVTRLLKLSKNDDMKFKIFIVDNAKTVRPMIPADASITVFEQRNVGGAGGFGRGLMESLKDATITHTIFMDDDAEIDENCIVRLFNILKYGNDNEFVGGVQFDVYDQTRIADPGTYWVPDRFERPKARLAPQDLSFDLGPKALMDSKKINFNGWWLFAGANKLFRRHGMPLPCFVHLDDVDYGVRVYLNGGATITPPGIAVWHEPYYAKTENWFAYYNIRNELVRISSHMHLLFRGPNTLNYSEGKITRIMRHRKLEIARQLRKRFFNFVGTYQYGSAYLLCKAIEDYLVGPALLLKRDAEDIHKEVMSEYGENNKNSSLKTAVPVGYSGVKKLDMSKGSRVLRRMSRGGHVWGVGRLRANSRNIVMLENRNAISVENIMPGVMWCYPDTNTSGYFVYRFDYDSYRVLTRKFYDAMKVFQNAFDNIAAEWSDMYQVLTSEEHWNELVKTF